MNWVMFRSPFRSVQWTSRLPGTALDVVVRHQPEHTLLHPLAVGQDIAALPQPVAVGQAAVSLQLVGNLLRDLQVAGARIEDRVLLDRAIQQDRRHENAARARELHRGPGWVGRRPGRA